MSQRGKSGPARGEAAAVAAAEAKSKEEDSMEADRQTAGVAVVLGLSSGTNSNSVTSRLLYGQVERNHFGPWRRRRQRRQNGRGGKL